MNNKTQVFIDHCIHDQVIDYLRKFCQLILNTTEHTLSQK